MFLSLAALPLDSPINRQPRNIRLNLALGCHGSLSKGILVWNPFKGTQGQVEVYISGLHIYGSPSSYLINWPASMHAGASTRSQEAQGGARRARRARSGQEEPGGAMRSQEQPGRVKRGQGVF